MSKPQDGFVSRFFNRPSPRRITRFSGRVSDSSQRVVDIDLCFAANRLRIFSARRLSSASSSGRQFFKRSVFLMVATAKLRVPRTWNQSSANDWITL